MSDIWIEAGSLDKRITIQVDTGIDQTDAGQHVENWIPWDALTDGKLWAAFRALTGREVERANQMEVIATHMLTTRWVPGLRASKMRAVLNGRILYFGWVNNVDEANVKAEILCAETIA